jgi:hypothetical protein
VQGRHSGFVYLDDNMARFKTVEPRLKRTMS